MQVKLIGANVRVIKEILYDICHFKGQEPFRRNVIQHFTDIDNLVRIVPNSLYITIESSRELDGLFYDLTLGCFLEDITVYEVFSRATHIDKWRSICKTMEIEDDSVIASASWHFLNKAWNRFCVLTNRS